MFRDEKMRFLEQGPLGKRCVYVSHYSPDLLFPIVRKIKRDEIGVTEPVPFKGFDVWNAYEVSWLNSKGKPVVAVARFDISCLSTHIIEAKSFKLYLNSFNNTRFDSMEVVKNTLKKDITKVVHGTVFVTLLELKSLYGIQIEGFSGESLDNLDIECNTYHVMPHYLSCDPKKIVEESFYSDLFKSNCLITGQPDWGSVEIIYKGPKIDKVGLLKYVVSFRNHKEFHEQCVERLFMDIFTHCRPEKLTVQVRYTRRGGLDINPIRSTEEVMTIYNLRMPRQ